MGQPPRTIRGVREEGRVASAWVLSVVGHVVLAGLAGLAFASSLGGGPASQGRAWQTKAADDTFEIDLPPVPPAATSTAMGTPAELRPVEAPRGGGEATPRLDTGQQGRGGTDTATRPALNLADRDEDLVLTPEMMSRLDRSQIQRLKASRDRRSREDWRASRQPMELTFVASGHDQTARPERRAAADHDPSAGAREAGAPRKVGGALGAADLPSGIGENKRDPGGSLEGAAIRAAGMGVRDGMPGQDHRDVARQAHARPMVAEGNPSVPSNEQGKPTDNKDAEQEVAAMQSILHASNAGGLAGPGSGGQAGPGPSGAGGKAGGGSISRALGTGAGPGIDVDPRDRRRSDYLRQVRGRIGGLVTPQMVPMQARIDGLQPVTIVSFTILADGTPVGASVTRPSGLPELDERCRQLVLKAGPYGKLPTELGATLNVPFSFDFRNQAVLPKQAKADP